VPEIRAIYQLIFELSNEITKKKNMYHLGLSNSSSWGVTRSLRKEVETIGEYSCPRFHGRDLGSERHGRGGAVLGVAEEETRTMVQCEQAD